MNSFYDFNNFLDDKSFSFLTNSWCSEDGKELVDYIFKFAGCNLNIGGKVVIILAGLEHNELIEKMNSKAISYNFLIHNIISGQILSSSLGVETFINYLVDVHIITFVKASGGH